MPTPIRLGASLSAAAALLLGAGGLARCWFGYDCGADALAGLSQERERRHRLDRVSQALVERNRAKEEVISELLAGRLTLVEAAAAFRRIHERTRDETGCYAEADPADLSDEGLCRNVLCWARMGLADSPRREEVLDRLNRDFEALFPQAEVGNP
jgi:hypothetical protein